jgi:hypothetical protein
MPVAEAAIPTDAQSQQDKSVRLHITPLKPDLLKIYLAPSVLPLAKNVSYHTVETFPEKGFGYVDLPEVEAQKLRKKLNGSTLRGSKVRIEMAKPEKRKAHEEVDAAREKEQAGRPSKRAKKDQKEKRRKEVGVLEGVELPNERKVKRGWTDPTVNNKKDRKEKKEKDKDKDGKHEQRKSKYTKEPELLFKAKLTPIAATEVARKDKKKDKKEKKSKSREVTVHEFENNTKTPSFLKETKISTEKKPAVEYINGQGWVDEDGTVVEPETGKARNRRVLELVDKPVESGIKKAVAPVSSSSARLKSDKKKNKAVAVPAALSESEADDDSSVVSSSSENISSDSENEVAEVDSATSVPSENALANGIKTPEVVEQVHPLEALFKRPRPTPGPIDLTPAKKLTPINTAFSFFENDEPVKGESTGEAADNVPSTPFTQKDLEWRGLRSAAPTPDTAAIGRRFSFDWRKGSQDAPEADDEEMGDAEAEQQLSQNTKANASKTQLPGVTEEDEEAEDVVAGEEQANAEEEKPESEFRKWFWENRGDLNRAWKKRRREALKAKRHSDNRKIMPHRRVN